MHTRITLGQRWVAIAAVTVLAALAMLASPAVAHADGGAVPTENTLPGTPDWYMPTAPTGSAADQFAGRVTSIDGWIWPLSAAPGDRMDLHVGTAPGLRYRVEVYRLGWYDGDGARLMACLPSCSGDQAGVTQPLPPAPDASTGMVRPEWSTTDSLTVPAGWPSGTYMAALRITSGPAEGMVRRLPFVIRSATPNRSKVVVIVPVNTWAAYNGWGGKSLYDNHSVDGVRASQVSFEKPWAEGVEIQNWRYDEYPMVRFLEREGLDVSYVSDWDVSSRPGILAGHRVVMTMGHGEYWSKEHRDALEAARDGGQNLAFMGANLGYWQVRYADGGRTLIGYKSDADPIADPALKTDLFRKVGRPECELIGVQYNNTSWPLGTSDAMSVADASLGDAWFAGSGFTPGASVVDMLGYEWDQVTPGCDTPPLTRLFRWEANGWPTADGVRYTAPSGAEVFGAGTLQFAWGLDGWRWSGDSGAADPRLVTFTRNMLSEMGGMGDSEPPAPSVTVTPATATVQVGATRQFTATLQNATGGVQWSVDGGAGNGTVTASGLYTAPAGVPAGGTATVRATHAASGATDTAIVTVSPPTPPQVTAQPADRTVIAGGTVTFTAAATAIPAPTVRWQVSTDGGAAYADIPGAGATGLTLTSVTAAQNGNRYRAVFTNSAGSATTAAATLTVTIAPVAPRITMQPASRSVAPGATVTLTAGATGAPSPAVQWQLSTGAGGGYTDIPEADATSLTLTGVGANQNGNRYRAVFTNVAGTAITDVATLTVTATPATPAPPPATAPSAAPPAPSVAIAGMPLRVTAGSRVQLTASVANLPGGVTWSASAGTISPTGRYRAPATPPKGGLVTVTATSTADPAVAATVATGIRPKPGRAAATGITGRVVAGPRALSRVLTGHAGARVILAKLQVGGRPGWLRVTATAGPRVAGRCAVGRVRARETVTCRIRMTRPYPLRKVRFTVRFTSVTGAVAVRRAWVGRPAPAATSVRGSARTGSR
jgi:hypothetical protein